MLTASEAVELVGCKDRPQFMREVRAGIWPKPIVNSRPPRWSRAALEHRIADLAGFGAASPSGGIGDAEWEKFA